MFEDELQVLEALQATKFGYFGHGINLFRRLNSGQASQQGLSGILDFLSTFSQLGELMASHSQYDIWPSSLSTELRAEMENLWLLAHHKVYEYRLDFYHKQEIAFWKKRGIEVPPPPRINPGLLEFLATYCRDGLSWKLRYRPSHVTGLKGTLNVIKNQKLAWMDPSGYVYYENEQSKGHKPLRNRAKFLPADTQEGWYVVEEERSYDLQHHRDQLSRFSGFRRKGKTWKDVFLAQEATADFLQIPRESISLLSVEDIVLYLDLEENVEWFSPELCRNMAETIDGREVPGVAFAYDRNTPKKRALMHVDVSQEGPWVVRFMIRLDDLVGLPFNPPKKTSN